MNFKTLGSGPISSITTKIRDENLACKPSPEVCHKQSLSSLHTQSENEKAATLLGDHVT